MSRAYTLLADGQIIYEADTEDELWEWIAVNLPDTVFWPDPCQYVSS